MQATATATVEAQDLDPINHQWLVKSIARKYLNQGLEYGDLMGWGNVGLLIAIERFRPEVGTLLSTYAYWWITQSIKRKLPKAGAPVTLPDIRVYDRDPEIPERHAQVETLRSMLAQIPKRHAEIMRMRFGLEPYRPMSLVEVGLKLGITKQRVQQIQNDAIARLRKLAQDQELTLL